MDAKLTSLADRLNAKLKGFQNQAQVQDDDSLIDLVDAHLDLVSASHGSCHMSCIDDVCHMSPRLSEATAAPQPVSK